MMRMRALLNLLVCVLAVLSLVVAELPTCQIYSENVGYHFFFLKNFILIDL
jgi:hypothetical protein